MTPEEEAHVQVPLTDFVRGVVDRAVDASFDKHVLNCPVLPRVKAIEKIGARWGTRFWGVAHSVITILVAAAVAWVVAKG